MVDTTAYETFTTGDIIGEVVECMEISFIVSIVAKWFVVTYSLDWTRDMAVASKFPYMVTNLS